MTTGNELDDFLQQFPEYMEKLKKIEYGRILRVVVLIAALGWLASGVYMVGPGEQAVILQFGREAGIAGPGLHYHFPRPIQTRYKVDVATVRRAEIGFRTEGSASTVRRVPAEALMLTGDENIVEAQLFIHYRVQNASDYLFKVRDPELTLRAAGEVALRGVIGKNTIDHTMTEGRVEIQEEVQVYLQRLIDLYKTGILVTEAKLLVVDPPDEVKEAFHEVVRAWEDRERLVQEAEAYQEDLIPRARGKAIETIKEAEAYKESRILEARGDAGRFTQVLDEYEKAQAVTRQRLYLEMIEKVLPNVKKYIIEGQGEGNLLQLLPLGAQGGER